MPRSCLSVCQGPWTPSMPWAPLALTTDPLPRVLQLHQVRCNATMSSLFMSVDEICRASLQLHCVFPHVLAK